MGLRIGEADGITMYSTTEARWFFEGGLPAETEQWFRQLGESCLDVSHHEDRYLRFRSEDLSVKIQGGRHLEHKLRTREIGSKKLLHKSAGFVESWGTWRVPVDPHSERLPPEEDRFWRTVHKRRLRYAVRLHGDEVRISPRLRTGPGNSQFELTHIRIDKAEWWSLGMEIYGSGGDSVQSLLVLLKGFLAMDGAPELPGEASACYPCWLVRLDRRNATA